jgi:hypothetical protein
MRQPKLAYILKNLGKAMCLHYRVQGGVHPISITPLQHKIIRGTDSNLLMNE